MTESYLLTLLVKSLFVVAVSGLGLLAMRRASAAVRCLASRLALVLLLALPILVAVMPAWTLRLLPSQPVAAFASGGADAPIASPLAAWLVAAYGVGLAVALIRMGAAMLAAALLARQGVTVERRSGFRVVLSKEAPTPFALGHLRPVVVLPAAALDWEAGLRENVIAHEVAHIERKDWAWLIAGRIAAAIYWPNPGVAWLLHRSRLDAEIAADDQVLAGGQDKVVYAEHLVRVARACRTTALLAPMAAEPPLTTRLRALLQGGVPRNVPGRPAAHAAFILAMLMAAPLAALAIGPKLADAPQVWVVAPIQGNLEPVAVDSLSAVEPWPTPEGGAAIAAPLAPLSPSAQFSRPRGVFAPSTPQRITGVPIPSTSPTSAGPSAPPPSVPAQTFQPSPQPSPVVTPGSGAPLPTPAPSGGEQSASVSTPAPSIHQGVGGARADGGS